MNEDTPVIVTLAYTDPESDLANECSISSAINLTITQNCACDASGVCTVGVQGNPEHFNGAASFAYAVSANGLTSNNALAEITVTPVDDAPIREYYASASVQKDTESIITLAYDDVDGDPATSCSISGLNNITETTPCSCTLGLCSVGVTGTNGYTGSASFDYEVNTGLASNVSTCLLYTSPSPRDKRQSRMPSSA